MKRFLTIAPSDRRINEALASLFFASSLRSYPEQKFPPTPYRTATGDSGSFSNVSIASESCCAVSELTQFLTSARLMPIKVMLPLFSDLINSTGCGSSGSAAFESSAFGSKFI